MAKSKHQHRPISASQRRQQTRQQRESHVNGLHTGQSFSSQNKKRRVVRNKTNPWPMVIGVLVIVLVAVGIFIYIASNQHSSTATATPNVQKTLTSLDPQLYSTVGAGSTASAVKNTFVATTGSPLVLQGSGGKPEFFYMGAEYCPYCAAQRWGIITALSRFGSFSTLTAINASEGSVPTYTFKGSKYTSKYIDFVPTEVFDNNQAALDKLSAAQQQIVSKYDGPPYFQSSGSFPFISIANQRVANGAFYDYNLLIGHTHADIVNQIQDASTSISQGVIGTANYLTAAICSVTHNQPANVCQEGAVPGLQQSLNASALQSTSQHIASVAALQDFIVPEREAVV
jgi:thiol-disulfide isomerase/thioredoxin